MATVFSTSAAFAALKSDGSVVTWGGSRAGGKSLGVANHLTANVSKIVEGSSSFVALKNDGFLIAWGDVFIGSDLTVIPECRGGARTDVCNFMGKPVD